MCSLPNHRRVVAMDGAHDVGVPTVQTTHCEWPQRAKVNHFMTRGIGVRKHAREALVAGLEFVKLIARDRDEAPPWSDNSLTRTWTRKYEDMKGATPAERRHFIRH